MSNGVSHTPSPSSIGPAYAMARVFSPPLILLGLLGRQRIAVSTSRDRVDEMLWRFQFTHRAILRMTDTGEWSWHTVTRNTRLEVEPLIVEALAIAAASPNWIDQLGGAEPAAPDWRGLAAQETWAGGASVRGEAPLAAARAARAGDR